MLKYFYNRYPVSNILSIFENHVAGYTKSARIDWTTVILNDMCIYRKYVSVIWHFT